MACVDTTPAHHIDAGRPLLRCRGLRVVRAGNGQRWPVIGRWTFRPELGRWFRPELACGPPPTLAQALRCLVVLPATAQVGRVSGALAMRPLPEAGPLMTLRRRLATLSTLSATNSVEKGTDDTGFRHLRVTHGWHGRRSVAAATRPQLASE